MVIQLLMLSTSNTLQFTAITTQRHDHALYWYKTKAINWRERLAWLGAVRR